MKLYHPFDGSARHARSLTDSAALTINWQAWVEGQSSHQARAAEEGHLERGSEIHISEKDVMNMTGTQLDDYMDWYERTFVDEVRAEEKTPGLPKQLFDMFPIGRQDGSHAMPYSHDQMAAEEQAIIDKRLSMMLGKLHLRTVVSGDRQGSAGDNEDSASVGSFYKRYRRVNELTPHARVFHEVVAEAIGVRLETLILAVGQVERQLIKWKDAKEKALREQDDVNMESTSDESV